MTAEFPLKKFGDWNLIMLFGAWYLEFMGIQC